MPIVLEHDFTIFLTLWNMPGGGEEFSSESEFQIPPENRMTPKSNPRKRSNRNFIPIKMAFKDSFPG